jgi:hypothetical protein
MPTTSNTMKKSEYFKGISQEVHKRRKFSEMSASELGAFHAGQTYAYKDVLEQMFPEVAERIGNRMVSRFELRDLCVLNIRDLQERLAKGRKVFKELNRKLQKLQQGEFFDEYNISEESI